VLKGEIRINPVHLTNWFSVEGSGVLEISGPAVNRKNKGLPFSEKPFILAC